MWFAVQYASAKRAYALWLQFSVHCQEASDTRINGTNSPELLIRVQQHMLKAVVTLCLKITDPWGRSA